MAVELSCFVEFGALPAGASDPVLVMAAVYAPAQSSGSGPSLEASLPLRPAATQVCRLEGCGLGWRVRPPLDRRSPWGASAQGARLVVEPLGGSKLERLYTLLEQTETTSGAGHEVLLGDLHSGDACLIPILVQPPPLDSPVARAELLRMRVDYVDSADLMGCSEEAVACIMRPQECSALALPGAAVMHCECLRVLVGEEMQLAAAHANAGSIGDACTALDRAVSMVATAPLTQHCEELSAQLLEAVSSARQQLCPAAEEPGRPALRAPQKKALGAAADRSIGLVNGSAERRTPTSVMGGSASEPGRTPLKPRTLMLPLAAPAHGEHSPQLSPPSPPRLLSLTTPPGRMGGGAESPPAAHAHWPRRAQQTGAKEAEATAPPSEAAGHEAKAALGNLGAVGRLPLRPPPMPLRLFGSAPFAIARRAHGSPIRGRPRLPPPVLQPLLAPPASTAGFLQPGHSPPKLELAAVPPLPPPGARERQGSYDAWLCRLLRTPATPLPLPDEIIMHLLSFLEPSLLFHASLALPTLIVDKAASVRGHHATISSALRAALPGSCILVRPGVYRESLSLEIPVTIVGSSGPQAGGGSVVITSSRNHTLHATAPFARLENVTLRQTGSLGRSCLLCSRGVLEVSHCDVSSSSGLCVEVTDTASPRLRRSRIHSGAAAGCWFRAAAGGLIEGSEIWGNGWSGVQISGGSNPTLLRNYIHDNKSAGLISFNHGRGVVRHNDITSNGKGGVQVRSRACPELRGNRIFSERSFGVWVYEQGLGHFEDNDIINNAWSGLQVEEGSEPRVVGNRLRGNRSAGIVVYNRGAGVFEGNDISANGRCGVQIKSGSAPLFRRNRIHSEKQAGVLTAEDGTGVLEENDIFGNGWSGVQTEGPSNPHLRRNRIHHNGGAGFIAYQSGAGLLEGNNIYANKKYGVQSKTGGAPTVRENTIHDDAYGIYLTESGSGVYEANRLSGACGGAGNIYVAPDCSPHVANNVGLRVPHD